MISWWKNERTKMITYQQVVGPWISHKDLTQARKDNIYKLLGFCARLEEKMLSNGVVFLINQTTESGISGKLYGGFRPQSCPVGAPRSNHKEGLALDRYDPDNKIDNWCMDNLGVLEECNIWIEHPDKTDRWSHWQCVPPKSGNRVFYP